MAQEGSKDSVEILTSTTGNSWDYSLRKGWHLENRLRDGSHKLHVGNAHSEMLVGDLCGDK